MTRDEEPREPSAPSGEGRDGVLFANLGSGSAGNASVIAWREAGRMRAILVDLGFAPRRIRDALASIGIAPEDVVGACLTHLDQDHYRPAWAKSLRLREIPVHVHERHRDDAIAAGVPRELLRSHAGAFEPDPRVEATATLVRHDEAGSVALRFDLEGVSIGLATDLGTVPPELPERFAGVTLLAIESNHCPRLQEASPRPAFLKRRIMGGSGHLSNEQAIAAIAAIAEAAPELEHVVLLHLSRQCNCPDLLQRRFAEALPELLPRLAISRQDGVTGPLRLARRRRRDSAAPAALRLELA